MTEKGAGYLRVGVKNGGCAGMEYVMDYVDAPAELDEVVEDFKSFNLSSMPSLAINLSTTTSIL